MGVTRPTLIVNAIVALKIDVTSMRNRKQMVDMAAAVSRPARSRKVSQLEPGSRNKANMHMHCK